MLDCGIFDQSLYVSDVCYTYSDIIIAIYEFVLPLQMS